MRLRTGVPIHNNTNDLIKLEWRCPHLGYTHCISLKNIDLNEHISAKELRKSFRRCRMSIFIAIYTNCRFRAAHQHQIYSFIRWRSVLFLCCLFSGRSVKLYFDRAQDSNLLMACCNQVMAKCYAPNSVVPFLSECFISKPIHDT